MSVEAGDGAGGPVEVRLRELLENPNLPNEKTDMALRLLAKEIDELRLWTADVKSHLAEVRGFMGWLKENLPKPLPTDDGGQGTGSGTTPT